MKLKKLYLTNNSLSDLPKEFFHLRYLNKIFLMGNKVLSNKAVMKQVKELVWLNKNISIFPSLIDKNSKLGIFPKEIILKILRDLCDVKTSGVMEGVREI